jgi:hypothetical protein
MCADIVERESEIIHIGHYILGRTIGKGGFAKVRCSLLLSQKGDMRSQTYQWQLKSLISSK